ncbi:MAG TPA: metal-sensing transcriptional repressor [Pseudogracilibacillus sp.]|nr:metal-sensing transcriptional repressor [Pseudogracilibacillus sp.]
METEMKKTLRPDAEKRLILNRLKRIEGQVRGIQKMVEDDRYCVDILIQINAINAAMKKVGYSILEQHTSHCVRNAVESGNGEEVVDELLRVIDQFAK